MFEEISNVAWGLIGILTFTSVGIAIALLFRSKKEIVWYDPYTDSIIVREEGKSEFGSVRLGELD